MSKIKLNRRSFKKPNPTHSDYTVLTIDEWITELTKKDK